MANKIVMVILSALLLSGCATADPPTCKKDPIQGLESRLSFVRAVAESLSLTLPRVDTKLLHEPQHI
jgi:PBP1b-binding outer membrane lipoprotein LpoB